MLVPTLATRCLYQGGMSDHRVRLTFCAIGSQPASQLASCNWPANHHVTRYQTLSGFGSVIYVMAAELAAQPHWAPVQGPSTPTGSPWGVTYLTKARQVTEKSSAACYIYLAPHLVTICRLVSILPNHIFLHAMYRNGIWTVLSLDQFMHILTPPT